MSPKVTIAISEKKNHKNSILLSFFQTRPLLFFKRTLTELGIFQINTQWRREPAKLIFFSVFYYFKKSIKRFGCLRYYINYPIIVAVKGFHTRPFTSDLNSLHENSLFLKNICHAADIIHINQGVYLKVKTLSALLGGKKTWPNIAT